jgi:hypothetical protein
LRVENLDIREHREFKGEEGDLGRCGVKRFFGRKGALGGLKEWYGKG